MKKNIIITVKIVSGINRGTKFDFVLTNRVDNLWLGWSEEFAQETCFNKSTNVLSFEDGEIIPECYVVAVTRE